MGQTLSLSRWSQSRSSQGRGQDCIKEIVKLQKRAPISQENQEKIFVLYGALDGHSTLDSQSFTNELFKVTNNWEANIPILDLTTNVNESWKNSLFASKQRCKADLVKVGDNWEGFYWPNNPTSQALEDDEEEETLTKEPLTLENLMTEMNKMKEEIQSLKKK